MFRLHGQAGQVYIHLRFWGSPKPVLVGQRCPKSGARRLVGCVIFAVAPTPCFSRGLLVRADCLWSLWRIRYWAFFSFAILCFTGYFSYDRQAFDFWSFISGSFVLHTDFCGYKNVEIYFVKMEGPMTLYYPPVLWRLKCLESLRFLCSKFPHSARFFFCTPPGFSSVPFHYRWCPVLLHWLFVLCWCRNTTTLFFDLFVLLQVAFAA